MITHYNVSRRILSGTFEFRAIDKSTNKVVKVTDGTFDLTQLAKKSALKNIFKCFE